jgi:hypothetical protein
VPGGVGGGVSGGVNGEMRVQSSSDIPSVDYSTVWTDTVERGPMLRQVRGLGTLVRDEASGNLIARVVLPGFMAADVTLNQSATVDTRTGLAGLVRGHVRGLGSATSSGETRTVDIALDGPLPKAAAAGMPVDGMIEIEKLDNVLQVGRPVHGAQNSTLPIFKIVSDTEAVRINVKFGRSSVNTIEVLDGLKEGDKIILSDMSDVVNAERIRLTDEKHLLKH